MAMLLGLTILAIALPPLRRPARPTAATPAKSPADVGDARSLPAKAKDQARAVISRSSEHLWLDVFKECDSDNDGAVTRRELLVLMRRLDIDMPPQEELSDFIRRFDVNENGVLDFQEFSSIIRALGQTPAYLGERSFRRVVSAHLRERRTIKLWRDVFNKLDAPPRSGKLDVYELCQAFDSLSFGIQLTRARRLIAKYDTNGDECLNFDEFKVRRGTRRPPLCRRRDSAGG